MAVDGPTRWGMALNCNEQACPRCARRGHKTRWCGIMKEEPQLTDIPPAEETPRGRLSTRTQTEGGLCKKKNR